MDNSKVFFSIVIPTYNRAALLRLTLESFLQQEFRDFEVLVIDDGGKDNSGEVVRSFDDPRFQYHWKENAERGAARNYGAKLAKGKWINFFDSDDLSYPNHLQAAYNHIKAHPESRVFHTSYDWKDISTGKVFRQTIQSGVINKRIEKGNSLSCNNVFIEKDTCLANPFSERRDLSGSEDWFLWLRLASQYQIESLPEITSSIVQHDSRSMVVASGKSTEQRCNAMSEELNKESNFNNSITSAGKIRSEMLSLAALHYAIEKDKKNAMRTLKKAVSQDPALLGRKRFYAVVKRVLF